MRTEQGEKISTSGEEIGAKKPTSTPVQLQVSAQVGAGIARRCDAVYSPVSGEAASCANFFLETIYSSAL